MSSPRYSQSTGVSLAAGLAIVIATFAFAQSTATSIIFAVSIAAGLGSIASIAGAPATSRRAHRALAAAGGLTAAWTILVSLGIFAGSAQYWVAFGGGVAIAALSGAGRGLYHRSLESAAEREQPAARPVAVAHARAA
jgi:hypothetical protein